jgi:hypothetical protein
MLQFDAAPPARSIPFFVNGKEFLSLNREMLGDMRRHREASPVLRRAARGTIAPAKFEGTRGPRAAPVTMPRPVMKEAAN